MRPVRGQNQGSVQKCDGVIAHAETFSKRADVERDIGVIRLQHIGEGERDERGQTFSGLKRRVALFHERIEAGRVIAFIQQFLEIFDMHPMLARNIAFYHPDLQGPIDVAEMIWGSDIFYAFYDDTELLRDFLKLITDTYILFMKKWFTLVPQRQDYSTHWGLMFKGKLMIRNDSLMNLSAQAYIDFIRPFDQCLLDEFGGGAIHFCGRGDHYVEAMSSLRGLTAVNLTQPELNDMEIIYRNTVDKGIRLVGLDIKAVENSDRDFRGQVQCFSNKKI